MTTNIEMKRNPPGKRFWDAKHIVDPGASNPSGVARSLVQAIAECRDNGVNERTDPAVRLIAYQLAHLLGLSEIEHEPSVYKNLSVYKKLFGIIKEKANEYEKEQAARAAYTAEHGS